MLRWIRAAIGGGTLVLLLLLLPLAASAHVHKTVGNYVLTVGFLNEPSYQGLPNGLDLRVAKSDTAKTPVTGLERTLKAEVIYGGQTMPLTLNPSDEVPGAYEGPFIPTATGDYTFHIFGTIDGQKIDEKVTSSPTTFDSVEAQTPLQFPVKVPAATELATKVQQAKADASSARTVGIIGIIVGALGLLAGGGAIAMTRRPAERSDPSTKTSSEARS